MRILITGATGMIGSELVKECHGRGIGVNYLTTSRKKIQKVENYSGFYWNPAEAEMDVASLKGVLAIVHLAGANVFRPWTEKNKQKIINSRVQGAEVIYKALQKNPHEVVQFVSASGTSVYPSSYKKMYFEDEQETADSFLGKLVREWEAAADKFSSLGIRVAKIRTGIVLSKKGGALPQMQRPVKYNLGAPLGNGRQWQSWIHIEDIVRIYVHVIINGLEGVYNAVAPNPITNEHLMREISRSLNKKLLLPNIPAFAIKLVMGEMANVALESQLVASKKIQETGFSFNYVNVAKALRELNGPEN